MSILPRTSAAMVSEPVSRLRPVPHREVAARIRLDPEHAAPVILSVSPCRSGSTVMLRVFGYAGVPSYFQPLKNLLRWAMLGETCDWTLPSAVHPIFVKETLGPFTVAESRFDPLKALLDAGLSPERLRLLVIGRRPDDTWISWQRFWRGRTCLANLIIAYRTTEKIRLASLALGIPTTHLVYEALRDHPPEIVIQRLFARLGVPYTRSAVSGWQRLPGYGEPGSNVILPREPPELVTPGIHDKPIRSLRYAFSPTPMIPTDADLDDIERLCRSQAMGIYRSLASQCCSDLRLDLQDPIASLVLPDPPT